MAEGVSILLMKAKKLKSGGTKEFLAGNYEAAYTQYQQVVETLVDVVGEEGSEEEEFKTLLQAGELNMAACKMRKGEWTTAMDMCSKVIAKNDKAVKAWYRRGDCHFNLKHWKEAKGDFEVVLKLEPDNKAAKSKIAQCEQKLKSDNEQIWTIPNDAREVLDAIQAAGGTAQHDGVQRNVQVGGDVPNFATEYTKKYGKGELSHLMKLGVAYFSLCGEATMSVEDQVQYVLAEKENPGNLMKRFGGYFPAFLHGLKTGSLYPGNILQLAPDEKITYGGAKFFQCMKNYNIVPWMLKTGETHVSIGCVDFAQLLFGMFEGDFDECTYFHGVDSSMVSITRCKLLYRMLLDKASSRSILQVWFSSAWSDKTLQDFLKSCKSLLQDTDCLNQKEKSLVKFWLTNSVSKKNASAEWMKGLEGSVSSPYEPCANFRNEVDRVEYARYLFTGYIFEEDEKTLTCGNRTMFAVPKSLGTTKSVDENFYFTLASSKLSVIGFTYSGSLKKSTDTLLMKQMDSLKGMVLQGQLKMTFEHNEISSANKVLLKRLKDLNPFTVDWSNIPDYFSKDEFMHIAQLISGEETVHNMHSMNWTGRVIGACILDYANNDAIKEGILLTQEYWERYHQTGLGVIPLHRALWRDNTVFSTILNITTNMLSKMYVETFCKYMFGNLEYNFDLDVYDHLSKNNCTICGAFTFAEDITLKLNLM